MNRCEQGSLVRKGILVRRRNRAERSMRWCKNHLKVRSPDMQKSYGKLVSKQLRSQAAAVAIRPKSIACEEKPNRTACFRNLWQFVAIYGNSLQFMTYYIYIYTYDVYYIYILYTFAHTHTTDVYTNTHTHACIYCIHFAHTHTTYVYTHTCMYIILYILHTTYIYKCIYIIYDVHMHIGTITISGG